MDPNELRKQKGEILAKAKAIQEELDSPESDLTDEQRGKREARIEELIGEAEGLETQAKAIEAREAQASQRRSRIESLAQAGDTGRRAKPDDPNPERPHANVEVSEPEFTRDPMKGFARPREFFSAVMSHHGHPKTASDPRLQLLASAGSDEHGTHKDSSLGFLVPESMSPDLLMTGSDENPFAGRTTDPLMQSPTVHIPARVDKDHSTSVSGGLVVHRRAETAAMQASQMDIERVTLQAHSLYGFAYATEELMNDSPRSVAALIEQGFGDEFVSKRIMETINGTGVGELLGILNSPALITVSGETVSPAQGANTIIGTNIMKMRARAWRYSAANSFWLANPDTYEQIAQARLVGDESEVWLFNPARGIDVPDTLLGAPIFFNEYAKSLGNTGDIILVSRASEFLYGIYQPLESAESIHVRFDRNERAFRFTLRDAGAPWWRSALTPKEGTTTLSPFVTLSGTRS